MLIRITTNAIEILGCPTKEELRMWAYNSGLNTNLRVKLVSKGDLKLATNFYRTANQIQRYVESYLRNNNRLLKLKNFHIDCVQTVEEL